MRGVRVASIAAAALLIIGSATAGFGSRREAVRTTITVMTRNLYLGANLDPIVHAASIGAAFQAVQAGWAQVQANDFPTRANAIAAEIAQAKPDFVGFQELVRYRTKPVSDVDYAVALDYETALRSALKAKKLSYRFVGVDTNTVAPMPSGNPPTMDIELSVRNGLLVRNGIRVRNVRTGNYVTTWPVLGGTLIARRGWVSADATVGDRTFRVITTHLESFDRGVAEVQSRELLQGPAKTRLPVVLLGDLNSRPDGSTSASYSILTAGGFHDAWAQAYPGAVGLTCCHGDDLSQLGGRFTERIDYVLARGGFKALRGRVTGVDVASRIDGLWPSDHGGLWMTLRLPRR
jgi:endonuclease/exonuclease/phosphatase family metal-dependent hydrolase